MYLKSLTITNYRKFGVTDNRVDFVASKYGGLADKKDNPIAASATLIVGPNNAGKTTVTNALQKLIVGGSALSGNDFNFQYLNKILDAYCKGEPIIFPVIEFEAQVALDCNSSDLLTNFTPFLRIGDVFDEAEGLVITVIVKYEIKETSVFEKALTNIHSEHKDEKELLFRRFVELLNSSKFSCSYFGVDGKMVEKNNFKLSNLINVTTLSANKNLHDSNLSQTFTKIIRYRYEVKPESKDFKRIDEEINTINKTISKQVATTHETSINEVLHKVESNERLSVRLTSNLTFDKLMNDLIKYEYTEQGLNIPEGQFGLGYTNLMSIIGQIVDYVERYPNEESESKVNVICIEEPETYMHPQMQELFIKYINDAVSVVISASKKKINSQLIITTHSSHILNSKIHYSNSFNNINYITNYNNFSYVVKLCDEAVARQEAYEKKEGMTEEEFQKTKLDDLKFLKKHIKYKVSELFFSDAVIFVEGVTEETLLSYYLDQDKELGKYYISVFKIDGAHGQVYHPLIKLLKIPVLIITDIDIKRTDEEKITIVDDKKVEIFTQMLSLEDRVSTNTTIHKFNGADTKGLVQYFKDDNLFGVFQKDPIKGVYASSFEEAFILQNYENKILNSVLKGIMPQIYKGIVGDGNDLNQLVENSYKLQKKLSGNKSDFANALLYNLIINDDKDGVPLLPKYIQDGLTWLNKEVGNSVQGKVES
jgi:predicted ATP-dependent endonuclease of OLD family